MKDKVLQQWQTKDTVLGDSGTGCERTAGGLEIRRRQDSAQKHDGYEGGCGACSSVHAATSSNTFTDRSTYAVVIATLVHACPSKARGLGHEARRTDASCSNVCSRHKIRFPYTQRNATKNEETDIRGCFSSSTAFSSTSCSSTSLDLERGKGGSLIERSLRKGDGVETCRD